MTILAKAGEKIKGRDGKVIATVRTDITSGDVNLRPGQFDFEGDAPQGAFLPEEIYEWLRERLSNPPSDDGGADEAKTTAKVQKARK